MKSNELDIRNAKVGSLLKSKRTNVYFLIVNNVVHEATRFYADYICLDHKKQVVDGIFTYTSYTLISE